MWLSKKQKRDLSAWAGCIAGALEQQEYLMKINKSGFKEVRVPSNREFLLEGEKSEASAKLLSITVRARKPQDSDLSP